MSYISIIERYHEYRDAIRELLASILTGVGKQKLFDDDLALTKTLCTISEHYPFVDLLYTLDASGIQISDNIACSKKHAAIRNPGKGKDRSQRPYFLLARDIDGVVITEPYLSSASRNLCISASLKWRDQEGDVFGYLVVDIDLAETIEFLMGDVLRRRFTPAFRAMYSLIVLGLFSVVLILMFSAFREVYILLSTNIDHSGWHIKPFGVIIFLTLALAVFDLGKTILEEEVLMHKDIFRHSSTRRTITRFIAAILIAVSIEALLMMFKGALGDDQSLVPAVWMMITAVGLLIGLGIYVYLGAKAEVSLLQQKYASK